MSGHSESKCKYCGDKIFWNNSTHYIDEDGEWRNQRLPLNTDGREHCCEDKLGWILARRMALQAVTA